MSVKPSLEALKLAATFTHNGKSPTLFEVIGIAGAFDAYLAGMIEVVPIKMTEDEFNVAVELKQGGEPEEHAATNVLHATVVKLCEHLSDEDLRALQHGIVPAELGKLLTNLARVESHLRRAREDEPGSDNGYGYTGGPDLGEVGAP